LLFPQRMFRLVWFVPESKLADGLVQLAETRVFHLAEQCRLGRAQNLDALKAVFRERALFRRRQHMLQLLGRLPGKTLLNYAVGELPPGPASCEGLLSLDNGAFFWAGTAQPPEAASRHLHTPEMQEDMPELPMQCSDAQWKLLFASGASVGHVKSWAVICGWFPACKQQHFERLLAAEHAVMTPAESSGLPFDEVPVAFERPAWLQGFAALMRTYGVTGYREIDPTILLAVGFVAMFGMMFADLGQGMVMFLSALGICAWAARHGREGWKKFGLILVPISLSATLFGTLFGSCFGYEDLFPALWFHPMDNILFYLGVSIFLGMATILTGMALGLINHWRMHAFKRMVWDHFALPGIVFYAGFILLVLDFMGVFSGLAFSGAFLCGTAALAVGVREACSWEQAGYLMRLLIMSMESFDFIMKFIVQTISFARIAAFTIAHLALSSVVIMATEATAFSPVLSGMIFILGNALIIAGEGALVAIQVLRLHFFEFFTKFVQGEGNVFTPFGREEKAV